MFKPTDQPLRHYRTQVFDSARWERFDDRDDDILICTSYKSGTTWMQRICALLIFRSVELDRPMSMISPWLEIRGDSLETMLATYRAQTHRRFIKTHTPLDGLAWRPKNMHLVVVRDPRDVFMSMLNHFKNYNPETRAEFAAELRDADEAAKALPDDPNEMFQLWLTRGSFEWEVDGFPYWSVFHHARTFWERRDRPNIAFFHYSDLQADLGLEMRRIAAALGIDIDEDLWPALVEAATFRHMKADADRFVPESHLRMWNDNRRFFNKGTSGKWQGVLSAESLALFDHHAAEHYPPDMVAWMLDGSAAGTP